MIEKGDIWSKHIGWVKEKKYIASWTNEKGCIFCGTPYVGSTYVVAAVEVEEVECADRSSTWACDGISVWYVSCLESDFELSHKYFSH